MSTSKRMPAESLALAVAAVASDPKGAAAVIVAVAQVLKAERDAAALPAALAQLRAVDLQWQSARARRIRTGCA